jgi:hypothetical protein
LIFAYRKAAQQRRTPKHGRKFDAHFALGVLECARRGERFSICTGSRFHFQSSSPRAGHRTSLKNLFARQSRFHLIKLLQTIALHAYATTIQN